MSFPDASTDRPDAFPTPREGLDNGSLTELRLDAGEVSLDVPPPHAGTPAAHHDIVVPDDASSLLEGMEAYGA